MEFSMIERTERTVEKEVLQIVFEDDSAKVICTEGEYVWREMDVLAQAVQNVDCGRYEAAREWLDACTEHAYEDDAFGALYKLVHAYLEGAQEG